MIARLLSEDAPFDSALAGSFLEAINDLAVATEADDGGLSRLPLELQASAGFVQGTVDYLVRGVDNATLEEFMNQVSCSHQSLHCQSF